MMKLLVVLGEGGHTKEMLELVDSLGPRYRYVYLLVKGDELSQHRIRLPGAVYRVQRPRYKVHNVIMDSAKTVVCAAQALWVLMRERPRAVVTCGPGVAVPVCLLAKLLGIAVVFIETGSRVRRLSTTGRTLYRFADLFLVQWSELLASHPKAIYAGRFW